MCAVYCLVCYFPWMKQNEVILKYSHCYSLTASIIQNAMLQYDIVFFPIRGKTHFFLAWIQSFTTLEPTDCKSFWIKAWIIWLVCSGVSCVCVFLHFKMLVGFPLHFNVSKSHPSSPGADAAAVRPSIRIRFRVRVNNSLGLRVMLVVMIEISIHLG